MASQFVDEGMLVTVLELVEEEEENDDDVDVVVVGGT